LLWWLPPSGVYQFDPVSSDVPVSSKAYGFVLRDWWSFSVMTVSLCPSLRFVLPFVGWGGTPLSGWLLLGC
jgi:hypothetical protein